ncbi:Crp/Fnr family transcriptional regulator [Mucilaginibacter polytrichastri]|uniref:Cyclic nucleotide-binding domain-containing protein n=1 Tax=Mucilaginibacter polytrichastri TaxID=1302689 RepID=A0A1Q5ZY55_9SPHI|nr:Crp/Fnr family transcriptional regulator [Mucilaginibacter polytrichastri]OKS86681.1 hypothetical protein RG47T_2138 [Mucilaginibacter polytrichastri]SFS82091.1 cAMP-binding domain of CRP or a regulatory subunit of cAMP-dependent protein kinases [Mucilaginibacter polytrichastri]
MSECIYNPLLDYMRRLVEIDDAAAEFIAAKTKLVSVAKGSMLFNSKETARHIYFIVSGKARSYYTDYSGKTITWMFHYNSCTSNTKNLFLVDYKSFLTHTPGTMSIEALTDVTLIQFGHKFFEQAYVELPQFEQFMRMLNESAFIVTYDRVYTLLTMNATDRYLKVLSEEPHLIQLFSNYYLASYLGVAPQSLSRIRAGLNTVAEPGKCTSDLKTVSADGK